MLKIAQRDEFKKLSMKGFTEYITKTALLAKLLYKTSIAWLHHGQSINRKWTSKTNHF
uniref:Uncharacterized protein n=1 Tax=Setaria italica TaxID=4555 RepID=K3YXK8_SETIT